MAEDFLVDLLSKADDDLARIGDLIRDYHYDVQMRNPVSVNRLIEQIKDVLEGRGR